MPYTPNTVVTQQFGFEDFQFTMLVSGTIDVANDVGKAVTLDTTAANTVKLAGNNDYVYGRIESLENRALEGVVVANISRKFRSVLPTTGAVALGNEVSGSATAGVVKATTTQPAENAKRNRIVEILTGNRAVVEKL